MHDVIHCNSVPRTINIHRVIVCVLCNPESIVSDIVEFIATDCEQYKRVLRLFSGIHSQASSCTMQNPSYRMPGCSSPPSQDRELLRLHVFRFYQGSNLLLSGNLHHSHNGRYRDTSGVLSLCVSSCEIWIHVACSLCCLYDHKIARDHTESIPAW